MSVRQKLLQCNGFRATVTIWGKVLESSVNKYKSLKEMSIMTLQKQDNTTATKSTYSKKSSCS